MSFVLRAKLPYDRGLTTGVYVFLTRDTWKRKCETTGSIYYWSNNMGIGDNQFPTEAKAWQMLNRLPKVKARACDFEVVPYQPGKQIFYLDGRVSPDDQGKLN